MKLPYRRGDSFALPLGNGQFADSWIVQCEHRVVVIALPCNDDPPLVLRVSDDALVLQRWKKTGRVTHDTSSLSAKNVHWMLPARAERLAAAALGGPHPRERHVRVRELRSDTIREALASIDDDSVLALVQPLDRSALEALQQAIHDHPGMMVRVHGGGVEHLSTLGATPLQRLTLGSHVETLPPLPALRSLSVIGSVAPGAIAASAQRVEHLSIDANGAAIDLAPLRALPSLRTLDLAAAAVNGGDGLASLHHLMALRLSRVTGIRDAAPLAAMALRALSLEYLHELADMRGIDRISTLEQLELVALWQFDIADLEWTLDRANLLRAEIDIGGRRKNVELYKRAAWAYPWRFPGILDA